MEGCNKSVLEGYRMCDDVDHLVLFESYQKQSGANSQLKSHLERTMVSNPPDEAIAEDLKATGVVPDEGIVEVELNCPQKPALYNRRL
jgi:hypothetical protein